MGEVISGPDEIDMAGCAGGIRRVRYIGGNFSSAQERCQPAGMASTWSLPGAPLHPEHTLQDWQHVKQVWRKHLPEIQAAKTKRRGKGAAKGMTGGVSGLSRSLICLAGFLVGVLVTLSMLLALDRPRERTNVSAPLPPVPAPAISMHAHASRVVAPAPVKGPSRGEPLRGEGQRQSVSCVSPKVPSGLASQEDGVADWVTTVARSDSRWIDRLRFAENRSWPVSLATLSSTLPATSASSVIAGSVGRDPKAHAPDTSGRSAASGAARTEVSPSVGAHAGVRSIFMEFNGHAAPVKNAPAGIRWFLPDDGRARLTLAAITRAVAGTPIAASTLQFVDAINISDARTGNVVIGRCVSKNNNRSTGKSINNSNFTLKTNRIDSKDVECKMASHQGMILDQRWPGLWPSIRSVQTIR